MNARDVKAVYQKPTLESWNKAKTGYKPDTRETWAPPKVVRRKGKKREVLE